jgi:hypothetical protein
VQSWRFQIEIHRSNPEASLGKHQGDVCQRDRASCPATKTVERNGSGALWDGFRLGKGMGSIALNRINDIEK